MEDIKADGKYHSCIEKKTGQIQYSESLEYKWIDFQSTLFGRHFKSVKYHQFVVFNKKRKGGTCRSTTIALVRWTGVPLSVMHISVMLSDILSRVATRKLNCWHTPCRDCFDIRPAYLFTLIHLKLRLRIW